MLYGWQRVRVSAQQSMFRSTTDPPTTSTSPGLFIGIESSACRSEMATRPPGSRVAHWPLPPDVTWPSRTASTKQRARNGKFDNKTPPSHHLYSNLFWYLLNTFPCFSQAGVEFHIHIIYTNLTMTLDSNLQLMIKHIWHQGKRIILCLTKYTV